MSPLGGWDCASGPVVRASFWQRSSIVIAELASWQAVCSWRGLTWSQVFREGFHRALWWTSCLLLPQRTLVVIPRHHPLSQTAGIFIRPAVSAYKRSSPLGLMGIGRSHRGGRVGELWAPHLNILPFLQKSCMRVASGVLKKGWIEGIG